MACRLIWLASRRRSVSVLVGEAGGTTAGLGLDRWPVAGRIGNDHKQSCQNQGFIQHRFTFSIVISSAKVNKKDGWATRCTLLQFIP
jgi:hypothetical protein